MAIKVNAPDWSIQRAATTRGVGAVVPGLPPAFVPDGAETEEFVAQPRPAVRGAGAVAGALDISIDLAPGEAAVLAVRHPSGALTFHAPRETTSRTRGGPAEVRFIVPIRATRTERHAGKPRHRFEGRQGDRRQGRRPGGRRRGRLRAVEAGARLRDDGLEAQGSEGRLAQGHEGRAREWPARCRQAVFDRAIAAA